MDSCESICTPDDIALAPFMPMRGSDVSEFLVRLEHLIPSYIENEPTLIVGMSGRLTHLVSQLSMCSSSIIGFVTPTCLNLEEEQGVECIKIRYADVCYEYLSLNALSKYIMDVKHVLLVDNIIFGISGVSKLIQAIIDKFPLLRVNFSVITVAAFDTSSTESINLYSLTNALGYWSKVSKYLNTQCPIELDTVQTVDTDDIESINTDFDGQFYNGFSTYEYRIKIPSYVKKIARCLKRKYSVHKALVISPPELAYMCMHVPNMLSKDYPDADIFVQSTTPHYMSRHYIKHRSNLEFYLSGCMEMNGSKTCLCNPSRYDLVVIVITGINVSLNSLKSIIQLLHCAGNYNIQVVN